MSFLNLPKSIFPIKNPGIMSFMSQGGSREWYMRKGTAHPPVEQTCLSSHKHALILAWGTWKTASQEVGHREIQLGSRGGTVRHCFPRKWKLHRWKLYFTADWTVFVKDLALFCSILITKYLVLKHTGSTDTTGISQTSSVHGQWKEKTIKLIKPQKCYHSNTKFVQRYSGIIIPYWSWVGSLWKVKKISSLWDKYIYTFFKC